jgi:hypothetical protein
MSSSQQGNVGLAFGMTIGAGLCTTLGAALAFCVPVEVRHFFFISCADSFCIPTAQQGHRFAMQDCPLQCCVRIQ